MNMLVNMLVKIGLVKPRYTPRETNNLRTEMDRALNELDLATQQLSNADPEYLDVAIHRMNAAKALVQQLLREAKRIASI